MTLPAFLVDECLPVEVTLALRQHGLDATDIVERALRGIDDLAVWGLAAAQKIESWSRAILTSLSAMSFRARPV